MSRKPFAYVTKTGNVVRGDVLERYALKEQSQQIEDPMAGFVGQERLVAPPYNPSALVRLLELNTYHYRSCKTKARDTAGLGWRLTPVDGVVDAPEDEEAAEPNEESRLEIENRLSEFELPISKSLEQAQFDFEAIGWGAVELLRGQDGFVFDLKHVPAHTLRWHRSRERIVQKRGNKKVWFKLPGDERVMDSRTGRFDENTPDRHRATEIMLWRNYTPKSDYYGVPDVIPALGAIVGDVSRRDYNIAFFENYGVPAYAVFISGDFDPGEPKDEEGNPDPKGMTDLERSINEHFEELRKNPHSTLVLSIPSSEDGGGEVEIEIKPLSVDVKEASFRLYRQDNRDEVLSAHGVDPYRVGIAETGSLGGSTAHEAAIIYKESVIEPRQSDLEDLLNKHVIQSEEWTLELEEVDTSDPAGDLELLTDLFAVGAVTPREIASHFADRFGLDVDAMDHPALNAHYVAGQPVDLEDEEPELEPEPIPLPEDEPELDEDEDEDVIPLDEVEAVLESLRDDVIRIAAKDALGNGRANGDGHIPTRKQYAH